MGPRLPEKERICHEMRCWDYVFVVVVVVVSDRASLKHTAHLQKSGRHGAGKSVTWTDG